MTQRVGCVTQRVILHAAVRQGLSGSRSERGPMPPPPAPTRKWTASHPEKVREYKLAHPDYHRNWSVANLDKVRTYMRRNKLKAYGITPERYQEILFQQNGVCAICRRLPRERQSLPVDHSHKTHQVRGLLCHQCNQALGLFKDNHAILEAARIYLLTTKGGIK